MSTAALIWLTIYGVATLMFFSVASVITFYGLKDLKDLLNLSRRKANKNKSSSSSDANNLS